MDDRYIYMDTKWEKATFVVQCLIFVAICTIIGMETAKAAEPLLELGANQSIYSSEDMSNEWSFKVNGGAQGFPIYATVGYEAPRLKVLGQPIAESDMFNVGLGVRETFKDLTIFAEGGWTIIDLQVNDNVRQEIVYTNLLLRHDVAGRNPPFGTRYDATYDVDDGMFWRVGLSYRVQEHVSVTASYKASYLDEVMTGKSRDWEEGQGYWREDGTYNLSAFEVGILFNW